MEIFHNKFETLTNSQKLNKLFLTWFSNTKQLFSNVLKENNVPNNGIRYPGSISLSDDITLCEPDEEVAGDIILITQFFISSSEERNNELRSCLHVNYSNPNINRIILLNERIYTDEELGFFDISTQGNHQSKIEQIVVNKRLDYEIVFDYVDKLKLDGYIILANLDIFFDKNIDVLRRTGLAVEKGMFSLLRYDYDANHPVKNALLCENWHSSQDTWIWHSKFNPKNDERKLFDFQLGIPGCDNSFLYLLNFLGYKTYNLPLLIKTYHYHTSGKRTYGSERIMLPYHAVIARAANNPIFNQDFTHPFTYRGENQNLYDYLTDKITTKTRFILPRLTGNEIIYGVIGFKGLQKGSFDDDEAKILNNYRSIIKNNAGIFLPDGKSIVEYAVSFINTFNKCDAYFDWQPQEAMTMSFNGLIGECYEYIYTIFVKTRIWGHILNMSNIARLDTPWTHTLAGQRLLIISPFEETIKHQIPNLDKIYGRDMFPNCTFTYLKPPITNGDNPSRPFIEEFNDFAKRIEELASADTFDIALVACGGYGTPILSKIYDMGKSGIYLGGDLQLMFGVYGGRWADDNSAMMRLYKNEYWVRPSVEERPEGFNKIEDGCYW